LRALAQVSRAFRKPEVRAALRGANEAKVIRNILCQDSKASTASAA
jgi:mannitol/fructose-specific phosphotransferase system IIA component (Ntr-type)